MSSDEDDSFAETYRSYKKSTAYFLEWLWCEHQGLKPKPATITKSTIGMLAAAKVLSKAFKKAKRSIPISVISALRDAIAKRHQAFAIYKELRADDLNHKMFNQRQVSEGKLKETLHILAPLVRKVKSSSAKTPVPDTTHGKNSFATLATISGHSEDEASLTTQAKESAPPPRKTSARGRSEPDRASKGTHPIVLEDDELIQLVEIARILQEMETMKAQLKQHWADAAKRTFPIPMASWMTSLAFWHFKNVGSGSSEELPVSSDEFAFYCRRICDVFTKQPQLAARFKIFDISGAFRFLILADAIRNLGALNQRVDDLRNRANVIIMYGDKDLVPKRDVPTSFQDLSEDEEQMEIWAVREILNNIKNSRNSRAIKAVEKTGSDMNTGSCEPVLKLIQEANAMPSGLSHLSLTLGMDLFLSVFEGFLWADEKVNEEDCKTMARHLSFGVAASIVPAVVHLRNMMVDAQVTSHLVGECAELREALISYALKTPSDFYHRSPWTAGVHMMEILWKANTLGQTLCSKLPIVPTTLHLYNALQTRSFNIPEIPVMEELCELYLDTVFHGARPSHDHASHFRRCVLGLKTDHEVSRSCFVRTGANQDESIEMGVGACPCELLDSDFILLHYNEYIVGYECLAKVYGHKIQESLDEIQKEKLTRMREEDSMAQFIQKFQNLVLPELRGPHPVGRINFFGIFDLCAKIMERFGRYLETGLILSFRNNTRSHVLKGCMAVNPLLEKINTASTGDRGGFTSFQQQGRIAAALAFSSTINEHETLSNFLYDI